MTQLTQQGIENLIYNNIVGMRSWALLEPEARLTALERLEANIENMSDSAAASLNPIDLGILHLMNGATDGVTNVAATLANTFGRLHAPFSAISEAEALEAARLASVHATNEQNNSMGWLMDIGYALGQSFSLSWPPFSMDRFQQAMEIAPLRRQALSVYDALLPTLGVNIAEMVSGIGPDSEFVDGRMPAYIDPNSVDAQTIANHHIIARENPSEAYTLGDAVQAGLDNPWRTAGLIGGPTYVAYRLRNPALSALSTGWTVSSNIVAGGTVDVARGISNLGHGVVDAGRRINARFVSEGAADLRVRLNDIDFGRFERQTTRLAQAAELSTVARRSRYLGRAGAFLGFIPLIGGAASAAESAYYGFHAEAAFEAGALSEEDYVAILAGLSVHAATGFGGFLAQGFDETTLAALEAQGHGEYLPDSLPHMAQEAYNSLLLSGRQAMEYLEPLERPRYLEVADNPQSVIYPRLLTGNRYGEQPGRYNYYVAALYNEMIPEDHPVIQAMLADGRTLEELRAQGREFLVATGEIDAGRWERFTSGTGIWHLSPENNRREHATAAEVYNDLIQRGPIYWRLMDNALANGVSITQFNGDIQTVIDDISQTYLIDETRANAIYDLGTTRRFGHTGSRYLTLATAEEWDRYETLGARVEEELNMLNMVSQNTHRRMGEIELAYFLTDEELTVSNLAFALEHNTYLRAFLEERGEYESLLGQYQTRARDTVAATTPVAIYTGTTLGEFFEHINGSGAAAHEAALQTALTDVRASHEAMATMMAGREHIEQAVLLIEALPASYVNARPELTALLERATELREMANAIDACIIINEDTLFTNAFNEYATALGEFMIESEEVLTARQYTTNPEDPRIQAEAGQDSIAGGHADDLLEEEASLRGVLNTLHGAAAAGYTRAAVITGVDVVGTQPREVAFASVHRTLAEAGVTGGVEARNRASRMAPADMPEQTAEAAFERGAYSNLIG